MSGRDDRINSSVEAALRDPSFLLWKTAWRRTVVEVLATEVANRIDVMTTDVSTDWDQLDDQQFLSSLVPNSDTIREICGRHLLPPGKNVSSSPSIIITTVGHPKDIINSFIIRDGCSKRTAGKLMEHITTVSVSLIPDLISQCEFADVFCPAFWTEVGHRIAATTFENNKTDSFQPDWLILNQLLLAEWLFGCQFSKAVHVRVAFKRMKKSLLGIRGQLFRIPTHISGNGIDDAPPTRIPETYARFASSAQLEIMRTLEVTADHTQAGNGIFYEHMKKIESSLYMKNCASLYEYTTLAYLATSCIEQLVRGYASSLRIDHLKPGGAPIGLNAVLIDNDLPALSADTQSLIQQLFDTSGSNIRNRMMHGLLLDSEAKWDETAAAAKNHLPMSVWTNDPFLPQNMYSVCHLVLARIDADLHRTKMITSMEFDWAEKLCPSAADIAFATSVSSDLIREWNEGRLNDDDSWVERLDRYAVKFMPSLQHFSTSAVLGWHQDSGHKPLARFCGFALSFEAAYRLTVHLLGFEVLQKSRRKGPSGSVEQLNLQTRMLDSRGIQSKAVTDAIVSHMPVEKREEAIRCLSIAVQARNAFAHGAILSLPAATKDALGNAFFKSLQTLVDCGLNHFTKEAAYYNWINRGQSEPGSAVDDWLQAKRQVQEFLDAY